MEKGGHVYILGSLSGTLYIGVTSDLFARIAQHRSGARSGFAHRYGCTRLLYSEPIESISDAIAREKQLKGWTRAKKLALITRLNPEFKDLAEHWGQTFITAAQSISSQNPASNPGMSSTTPDPFNLQRFLDAQDSTFDQARAELAAGQKRSHWMWFIFPQVRGLGSSPISQRFAIANLEEAAAYLQHPTLGPRLRDCTALVNAAQRPVDQIFGFPDNLKFHSSITLFAQAAEKCRLDAKVFTQALTQHFAGRPDPATLRQLSAAP